MSTATQNEGGEVPYRNKPPVLRLPDGTKALTKEELSLSVRPGDLKKLEQDRIEHLKASAGVLLSTYPHSKDNDRILDWMLLWDKRMGEIAKEKGLPHRPLGELLKGTPYEKTLPAEASVS